MSIPDNPQLSSEWPIPRITEAEFQKIRDLLHGLLFGSVEITIQDGVIVQIDRTEKHRLRGSKQKSTSSKLG